jgi:chitinase
MFKSDIPLFILAGSHREAIDYMKRFQYLFVCKPETVLPTDFSRLQGKSECIIIILSGFRERIRHLHSQQQSEVRDIIRLFETQGAMTLNG